MSDFEMESEQIAERHPRVVAQETLQDLLEYSKVLEIISKHASERVYEADFPERLTQLIDGISTFTEAITSVRMILRIGLIPSVSLLEADLLSLLKDLLSFQEKGQKNYVVTLLKEHLPHNFEHWREKGIPELIRSRDS